MRVRVAFRIGQEAIAVVTRSVGPGVFFFQAEDGIRDLTVTGVQTCALPIYPPDYVFRDLPAAAPSEGYPLWLLVRHCDRHDLHSCFLRSPRRVQSRSTRGGFD